MTRFRQHPFYCFALGAAAVALGGPARETAAAEWFDGWQLEASLSQAHLVMVARVVSVSQLTIVEGAKTDTVLREYRFQPVLRLKGIFQRDQLSMTAADLGCPAEYASVPPPVREGELRLLILVQQQGGFMGCVAAAPGMATLDQRVPLLSGPDDAIVRMAETLIQVHDSQSRRERATLVVGALESAHGPAAVPLLYSLRSRSLWAAGEPNLYSTLARLIADPSPAIRAAALDALVEVLETGAAPDDDGLLGGVYAAVVERLEANEPLTRSRERALAALGHLGRRGGDPNGAATRLVEALFEAPTYTERAAAATALANLGLAAGSEALARMPDFAPLDELPERETTYLRALERLDAQMAETVLVTRIERSLAAGQSISSEVEAAGRLQSFFASALLLKAANDSAAADDRYAIAAAFARLRDERAVPVLLAWLRDPDYFLRESALAALEAIDSPDSSGEARLAIKSEPYLPYKLRLARLAARHGSADGYALASEHLADDEQTLRAALVLAELDDPRTKGELSAILAGRPDRRWHAAALTGLVALDDADAKQEVLGILQDERHPLVADAAAAVGLSTDTELLSALPPLIESRNSRIAQAALLAARRFLHQVRTDSRGLGAADAEWDATSTALPEVPEAVLTALAAAAQTVLLDAYVDPAVRLEAYWLARRIRGDKYEDLLTALADQAELEGTQLLDAAERELRRMRSATPRNLE